jgi:hypothetical protein
MFGRDGTEKDRVNNHPSRETMRVVGSVTPKRTAIMLTMDG